MKVLNLRCAHDHRFEGWFKSDEEMRAQLDEGRLVCPLCGDAGIVRLPSAPHIVVSGGARPPVGKAAPPTGKAAATSEVDWVDRSDKATGAGEPASKPGAEVVVRDASNTEHARQAAWLQRLRQVIAATDDVGDRFATEARRMHYGEAEERSIRGRATKEEARALVDEGIDVVALPTPEALKGTLQ